MDVRLLTYEQTQALLAPADCVAAIEAVYAEEAKRLTVNRPRSHVYMKHDAEASYYYMTMVDGGVKRMGCYAIRVGSGVRRYVRIAGKLRNEYVASVPAADGTPRWLELILLFDTQSGALRAVMPGGYIQKMRVGCTTALATRHMARKGSRTLGLIGSGGQAGAQLLAHREVLALERVRVYSTTAAHRERFCADMSSQLGLPVEPVASAEAAVRGADVVVCATSSVEPVLSGEWLAPGTHWAFISQNEVGRDAFERSDRIVVHSHTMPRNAWVEADGPPIEGGGRPPIEIEKYPELADLVGGRAVGRGGDAEITCFANTQGLGIQFVALTALAYERAAAANVGRLQNWDALLQGVHP